MKLHIGGVSAKDEWKILNIQPIDKVDFIGTITDLSQFDNESVSQVYASHVFEHVLQKDALSTLQGIHRILKPLGKLYLSVPDLDILCQIFIDPKAPLDAKFHAMKMMFGGQVDEFDIHYMGWNQAFLFDYLGQAGFSEGKRVESFKLFADTSDYKPYGFLISLNVIAIK